MSSISDSASVPEIEQVDSTFPREVCKPASASTTLTLPSGRAIDIQILREGLPSEIPSENENEIWTKNTLFNDIKMHFNGR